MAEAPPLRLLLAEVRAAAEYVRYLAARSSLRQLRGGDRHPVIVYPGFLAGDPFTAPLREHLASLGYPTNGWGFGMNMGLKPGLLTAMQTRVRVCADSHRQRVSLVGWSLGGLYARELAKLLPDRVRQVITLGTPVGDLRANHAWRLYERLNDHKVDAPPLDTDFAAPPPVPITAIYTRDDGIVAPASTLNPPGERIENIEVRGSHMGLPWNPEAIRIVADRLAQPEGKWRPYKS